MYNTDVYRVNRNTTLASMLAAENITIQFSAAAETASFNILSRKLTLPIWKDSSPELIDMLLVHEVGHALHSGDLYKNKLNFIEHQYVNILDDIRVDRKQRELYPGTKRDYFLGSKRIFEIDFFKLENRNISEMIFIDRVNIFSKLGSHINIPFSDDEKEILKQLFVLETNEEIIEMAKKLIDQEDSFKEEEKQNQENKTNDISADKIESGTSKKNENNDENDDDDGENLIHSNDDSDDYEDEDDNSKNNGDDLENNSEGKGGNSENNFEGEDDDSESEGTDLKDDGNDSEDEGDDLKNNFEGEGDDSKDDGNDSEDEGGNSEDEGGNSEDKDKDDDGDDSKVPETTDAMNNLTNSLIDPNIDTPIYCTVDKVDWRERIFTDDNVEQKVKKIQQSLYAKDINECYRDLLKKHKPAIEILKKQFNVLKQAYVENEYTTSKGELDENLLHLHKITDNIFTKTLVSLSNSQSHRIVFLMDYSYSMVGNNIKQTMTQIFILREFCKAEKIPFELFAFCGNKTQNDNKYIIKLINETHDNNYFTVMYNLIQEFRLYEIDFASGGTPLNNVMETMYSYLKYLRSTMIEDKLNFIVLTDGAATDCQRRGDVVTDSYTKKQYDIEFKNRGHIYPSIYKMLKDNNIVNSITLFIIGDYKSLTCWLTNKKQNIILKREYILSIKNLLNSDEAYLINQTQRSKRYSEITPEDTTAIIMKKMKISNLALRINKMIAKNIAKIIA